MPESAKPSPAAQDALLGRVLVKLGILTAEALRSALADPARTKASPSGGPSATLTQVLLSRGLLSASDLDRARAEQSAVLGRLLRHREDDLALAKKLVDRKVAGAVEVNQCLKFQAAALEEGGLEIPRLGAILVDRGFATAQAVALAQGGEKKGTLRATAPSAEELGSLGKYKLVREVGRGGMGVVYEALDQALDRTVALKIKMPSGALKREALEVEEERFIREARLAAQLPKHPHIVSVYEAGIEDGKHYLAMEFIRGKPFSAWRKKHPVREQIRLLRDVALAVHHAHQNGVLHRDLKPDNVLVDDENRPFITDFGLAKPVGAESDLSLTMDGTVVGTPSYMSPEQSRGFRNVDARSDVYSLGVMLYEILAGQLPFRGNTPFDVLMKANKEAVVPPSKVLRNWSQSGLDDAVENICLKALSKRAEDRYRTAQGFADDLSRWMKGEEVKVVVTGKPRPLRNRAWLVAGAAGVLVLALVLFFALHSDAAGADLGRGRKYMTEGNYTEALVAFGQALARDPMSAEARRGQTEARAALDRDRLESERKAGERERAIRKEIEEKFRAEGAVREAAAEKEQAAARKASEERRKRLEADRRKEEAARKEETARAAPPAIAEPPRKIVQKYPISEDTWKQAVNLLGLVDPGQDAVSGTWKLGPEGLSSDSTRARLEFPYRPPEDYDFRVSFTRQDGVGDVAQILSRSGASFVWKMGAFGNHVFGFAAVEGQDADKNPTRRYWEKALENGHRHVAVVQVRRDGLRAFLDGDLVVAWNTDYKNLGPAAAWEPRNPGVLGVGSWWSPTVFHSVEVLEVSGKGEPVARAPAASPAPAPVKPGLPAIPPAPRLKEAEKALREQFKSDYARSGISDRRVLAQKLLAFAQTQKDDPAALYVALREARDLAAQGGDAAQALAAVDALVKAFAVDGVELGSQALGTASRNLKTPEAAASFVEAALGVVEGAVGRDDFDTASGLIGKAESAAKATGNAALVGRVQAQGRDLGEVRKEYQKARGAEKTLESKPEDPSANLITARYLCFAKHDWEKGIPRLAKGSDAALRAAAQKEIANPTDAIAQAGVGDAWWDGAEKESGLLRSHCLERAVDWYGRAWPESTGGIRARLRDRFRQIFARPGGKTPRSTSGDLPTPWLGGQKGVCVLDDRYAHSGAWSAHVIRSAQAGDSLTAPEHPPVPAKAGDRLTVTAWALSEGTAADVDFLYAIFVNSAGEITREGVAVPADQPFWTRLEKTFVCPAETTGVIVRIESSSPEGSIWIDDLSLHRAPPAAGGELLQNGSFEQK